MAAVTAVATGAALAAGGGLQYMGAQEQARAASGAAKSQRDQARDWMNYVQQSKQEALNSYDTYSAYQQANIDKSLQQQSQNIARQQKLVDSIDPALIESGKQLTQLLQGQSAPVLQNMKDQRQLQRQNLLDTLRQQLGPGAETSSIGMSQLQKFDAETANALSSAQQQYIDKLSGMSITGAQTLGASLGAEISRQAGFGEQYGQMGRDRANIITGATSAAAGPQAALMQTAGADQVGAQLQGQALQGLGNNITQFGGAMAGAFGGGGGAAKATPGTMSDFQPAGSSQLQPATLGSSVSRPQGTYGVGGGKYQYG